MWCACALCILVCVTHNFTYIHKHYTYIIRSVNSVWLVNSGKGGVIFLWVKWLKINENVTDFKCLEGDFIAIENGLLFSVRLTSIWIGCKFINFFLSAALRRVSRRYIVDTSGLIFIFFYFFCVINLMSNSLDINAEQF